MDNIFGERIKRLRNIISNSDAGAFFITNPINVRYMSGFSGGDAQLLITESENILITDFRYLEQAAAETHGLYEIKDVGASFNEFINKFLSENNIRTLAIEENHMTIKNYKDLKNELANIWLIAQNDEIENLRQIKDETELNYIKKAVKIADEVFSYIIKNIKPGMTENYVKNELEYKAKQLGASGMSFETIVASGKNSSMPHAASSDKIIEEGDIVTIDFGCVYKGYCSDMTRTFFVGDNNKKFTDIQNNNITINTNKSTDIEVNKNINDKENYNSPVPEPMPESCRSISRPALSSSSQDAKYPRQDYDHRFRDRANKSKELIKIHNIVNAARELAINKACAGITGKELDEIARNYITKHGYGENFGHGLGHGVGLIVHDGPRVNRRNENPLPTGAVITIEPGIYIEGMGGVRIEDMILIEDNGCEILTSSDRSYIL